MIAVKEIEKWLDSLHEDEMIGIDDGGLTMTVNDNAGIYLEIGGLGEEGE